MTVVISGGGSGIGLACAQWLASHGENVALLDLNPNLEAALNTLDGVGHTAHKVNVCDAVEVAKAIDEISADGPISGLVISAGIVSQTPLLEISAEDFSKVLEINVSGVQNVAAPVAKSMIAAKTRGSIVILGSIAAFNGGGFMGRGAYSASKAAVLGLAKSYARELAPQGIRVNVVAPGATETPMTASLDTEIRERILAQTLTGRFLEVGEVVSTITFLLSGDSTALNGQTLHANGGSYFG
jgi:3-oxoacyl-[acyl-carrier protein] reductase